MEIKAYLNEQRQIVEDAFQTYMLEAKGEFAFHIESMRYSLFVGGKRVRPILCLAAAQAISPDSTMKTKVLPVCCALECIHTYSLIHDDLPAMDDDNLRRGKPTNHVVYGEAAAILAGDGLLTLAFDLLSSSYADKLEPQQRLQIISIIAKAAGSPGMVGGQALDIASEGKNIDFETLKTIHRCKTGALITAAILAGAVAADANDTQYQALEQYGKAVGLAFQIVDDLLDVESTTEELGKEAGSDVKNNKATYPSIFGVKQTKKMANEAVEEALFSLTHFDEKADPLRELAKYIVTRKK